MLYLASDHRGFELKEKIKPFLAEAKISFEDLGAFKYIPGDDYPDYAKLLAGQILKNPGSLGVALCGSGAGMSIVLNKFDGIRAGLSQDPKMAAAQKQDNDINVLVIPADFIDHGKAFSMVKGFLAETLKPDPKYRRRLDKIREIEQDN